MGNGSSNPASFILSIFFIGTLGKTGRMPQCCPLPSAGNNFGSAKQGKSLATDDLPTWKHASPLLILVLVLAARNQELTPLKYTWSSFS